MKIRRSVIIDGQVLQTTAWSRGMGRYLLSLLDGIEQNGTAGQRIIIAFSNNLELDNEKKTLINKLIPSAELVFLNFSKGLSDAVERKNSKVLDDFVDKNNLEGALFILASLFSFDYQPAYPTTTTNACIFYDIIPLKRWSTFYKYFPEKEYFSRFKLLYNSDRIYSISQSVKGDLERYLGFNKDDIVNIDGAEIRNFEAQSDEVVLTKPDYRYILLSGGDSPHKNMLRAIRAFDIFNAEFGDAFKLVVTSYYSKENIKRMKSLSANVVIAGEVSDSELHNLYEHAELVLFPSLDEGLGLPILEAVGYDKKIACSNIPVFKEISKNALFFFDPLDINDIAYALKTALVSGSTDKLTSAYASIKNKFQWTRTANLLMQDLRTLKYAKDRTIAGPRVSVIIEQDGDTKSLYAVAKIVRKYYKTHSMRLFVDTRFEEGRRGDKIPIVFDAFIPTHDIIDAVRKTGDDTKVVIYTPRSVYSQVLFDQKVDSVYLGTASASNVGSRAKRYFLEKKSYKENTVA